MANAEINENKEPEKKLFTGQTIKVKEGTQLKMTVSSVLSSGYSEAGDEFFAEVTNDLTAPNGVLIPAGTLVMEKLQKWKDQKGWAGMLILI